MRRFFAARYRLSNAHRRSTAHSRRDDRARRAAARGADPRAAARREHVLVANVDQLVIVMSLVEPDLKPHLIDRYLASAEQGGLQPVAVPEQGRPGRPGGLPAAHRPVQPARHPDVPDQRPHRPRHRPAARAACAAGATVFSGQSGVGKSSLLNAIQPDLGLRGERRSAR